MQQPVSNNSSLTETAYEAIKRDIRLCRLLPGTRFTEKQLVAELGYGKTPIGEALARLVVENVVRVIPRSGYEVIPLTLRDFEEVTELSRIVWPAMMALACDRSTDAIREQMKAEIKNPDDSIEESRDFLRTLAYSTGNTRLAEMCMRLYDEMERFVILAGRSHPSPGPLRGPWGQAEQKPIFQAFLRRDTAEVARLAMAIVDQVHQETLALLQSLPAIRETPLV